MARHFFSMFWEHEDVYAKSGKNDGYFSQWDNRWNTRLCPKQRGEKAVCDECENTKWTRLNLLEFQLGSLYKADYLLMEKSYVGFEFGFIELESPYGNITLKAGQLGAEFRDGISQLEDYVLDMSRFHYVVVAGRRTDFRDKTYIIKRERKRLMTLI